MARWYVRVRTVSFSLRQPGSQNAVTEVLSRHTSADAHLFVYTKVAVRVFIVSGRRVVAQCVCRGGASNGAPV